MNKLYRIGVGSSLIVSIISTSIAFAQEQKMTCAWVNQKSTCHTLSDWERYALLWCDRAKKVEARRKEEQELGWGTNAMYETAQGAEFARDLQLESEAGMICAGEQQGLAAAVHDAAANADQ